MATPAFKTDSQSLREFAKKSNVQTSDVDMLHKHGLSPHTCQRLEMHGISLAQLLAWVQQYGPQVILVVTEILNHLKTPDQLMAQRRLDQGEEEEDDEAVRGGAEKKKSSKKSKSK